MEASGSKSLGVVLIVVFVLGLGGWGEGCWEQEKLALLQLKPFFDVQIDPLTLANHSALYDWVEESSDCCQWERVECDPTNGRVIGLSLTNCVSLNQHLNTSLFLPFEELKSLSLSETLLAGCLDNEGFEKLALKLKKLEDLDLSFNNFNDSDILLSLLQISSLKSLNLAYNELNGPLHTNGFEKLALKLKKLEVLDLSFNNFNDSNILSSLLQISSLKSLNLAYNELNGPLHTNGFEKLALKLKKLEDLDLSFNNFNDSDILLSLLQISSLKSLNLAYNEFNGPLYTNGFEKLALKLKKLEDLDLSFNNFNDSDILLSLLQISSLKSLNLAYNELNGPLHTNGFEKLALKLKKLEDLDLSFNNFNDSDILLSLLQISSLKSLNLAYNELNGPLHTNGFRLPFHSHMKLVRLDVSSNFIDGHIPIEIGLYLPGLKDLNLSNNCLDGSIPSSIGDMKSLNTLDLSNNRLSGTIPEYLFTGCFSLESLVLSNNTLQGWIFPTNFNLTNLRELYLGNNNFTGPIPNSLSNFSSLIVIDIGYNHISGGIPRWMGNMPLLQYIMLPNNHIEGLIPRELCQLTLMRVLDLTMNYLSGTLPACFNNQSSINHLHLSKNRLQGSIPNEIFKNVKLRTLDLSYNKLTGNIPNCVGNLSNLAFLVLKHNNLGGEIPDQLCQLDELSLIDLSHNNLSGHIPNCLNLTVHGEPPRGLSIFNKDSYSYFSVTNQPLELTTKSRSYSYKGRILRYLSGIDLSSNKLTGEIPQEMGNLHKIVMLNLSHNSLTGSIPPSFSNLKEIESLDLSYNNLSGNIPPQFVELNFLDFFNVSYNNLSGKPPPRQAQFSTDIDTDSYWGNPFLCGEPLPKNCSTTPNQPVEDGEDDEDGGLIDFQSFYVTFTVSYIMALLCITTVMYINPHWRRAWFCLVERSMTSCFYFVIDNLPAQFCCGKI